VIDFDAPDFARRIEQLSQSELNRLPFGVILLDPKAPCVLQLDRGAPITLRQLPLGQNFFGVSTCMDNYDFRGGIARGS
jgi:hypothetical protein